MEPAPAHQTPEFSHLETRNFDYPLPDEAIARFPLPVRDASRLLEYQRGTIRHHHFHDLPEILPANTLLVFNDTRVLPARLHFQKDSGTWIEILIVDHPDLPSHKGNSMVCGCLIGNKKKWKEAEVLRFSREDEKHTLTLEVQWENREEDRVLFRWLPEHYVFSEVLSHLGEMPIPPYLNRQAEESDKSDYQTVYAKEEGAVAAPTAGLHFTDRVLANLEKKGVTFSWLTLHVGMGTFRPMKSEKVAFHEMHAEEVVISRRVLESVRDHNGPLVAVGTTSIRSLESMYWLGTEYRETGDMPEVLQTADPYRWADRQWSRKEAAEAILEWLDREGETEFRFFTCLYIMPGYRFRVVDGLITNFHQPKSTLLVLISAFIGEDWRSIYKEALEEGYRFLSYGDSSILWPRSLA